MKLLTKTYRVMLSENDLRVLMELKKYRIKPTRFVREAIREKIKKDLPVIIRNEKKRIDRIKLPF